MWDLSQKELEDKKILDNIYKIFVSGLDDKEPFSLILHDNGVAGLIQPRNGKFFTKSELTLILGKNYIITDTDKRYYILSGRIGMFNKLFYLLFKAYKTQCVLLVKKSQIRG